MPVAQKIADEIRHVKDLNTLLQRLLGQRVVKARGVSDDVTALEAEVNERVYRLFGLTREEIALIEEG